MDTGAKNIWAVWKMGYINTCSNAIEGRHGNLNRSFKRKSNLSVTNRIIFLVQYIIDSYRLFNGAGKRGIHKNKIRLQEKVMQLILLSVG